MENIKLNFVHVCDQVIIAQESNNVSLINMFNEIRTNGFPAVHPRFAVISNTLGPKGSCIQEIEVVDPDGNTLATASGNTDYSGFGPNNFVVNFSNFLFPKAGEYSFRIKIDGKLISDRAAVVTVKSA